MADAPTFEIPLQDGTEAAPSLAFINDLDTGIYRSGSGVVNVVSNAARSLEVGLASGIAPQGTTSIGISLDGSVHLNATTGFTGFKWIDGSNVTLAQIRYISFGSASIIQLLAGTASMRGSLQFNVSENVAGDVSYTIDDSATAIFKIQSKISTFVNRDLYVTDGIGNHRFDLYSLPSAASFKIFSLASVNPLVDIIQGGAQVFNCVAQTWAVGSTLQANSLKYFGNLDVWVIQSPVHFNADEKLLFGTFGSSVVSLSRSAAGVLRMLSVGGVSNEGLDWDFDIANLVTVTSSTGAGIDFVVNTTFTGRVDINNPIALGGGAAATLGTIGGAGPTAAAQSKWIEQDVAGVPHWVAAWV